MNNINHRVNVNTMLILSIKLFHSRTAVQAFTNQL